MPDVLTSLLTLYPAGAQPQTPPSSLGNAGGTSGARLWTFESALGPLVARAWPIDGRTTSALMQIHDWLARLADLDFVPVPIAARDGRSLLEIHGQCWEIAPWRPGTADSSRPPSCTRLRSAFAGLAAVHQRLAFRTVTAPSPGLIARLDESKRLLTSELNRMAALVHQAGDDPLRASALRWITLARAGLPGVVAQLLRASRTPVPLQPVLRDARAEHFLFGGDLLTGLVDFGAMGIDSPAADLARLLAEWVGPHRAPRAEALDAYAAIRHLDPVEDALIDVFAESSAWLGPARWVRWHFADSRHFDDPGAARIGLERSLNRLVERLTS